MNQKRQQTFKPTEAIMKFMGGVAAITAGLSALLSVSGFLLLRSHANLLGISSVLHHSVGDYLYEGGVFFISTFLWALPASIIGNIYGWIGMGIVTIYLLGKRLRVSSHLFGKVIKSLKLQEVHQQAWFRWVCIVISVFLILLIIGQLLPSPEAKDLLFPFPTSSPQEQEIAKRANEEAIKELANRYVNAVLYVVLSGAILWGIHKISKDTEEKPLFVGRLFLYLFFTIQLILLPINYGQTVYSSDFHKVAELILDKNLQGKIPRSANIWLLNENDDKFVLYLGDTQKVFLVQKEQVLNIAIKERVNIFKGR